MKKMLVLLLLTGCSSSEYVSGTITAKNGHSIVSEYNKASELECSSSGSRLDFFIDMDDSLSPTVADTFTNSIVVCDGANGQNGLNGEVGAQGPQGLQGAIGPQGIPGAVGIQGPTGPQGDTGPAGTSATIKAYTSTTCAAITGSTLYIKIKNGTASIYSSNTCASNSKLEEVNEGGSYFVTNNRLLVYSEEVARVITFN